MCTVCQLLHAGPPRHPEPRVGTFAPWSGQERREAPDRIWAFYDGLRSQGFGRDNALALTMFALTLGKL